MAHHDLAALLTLARQGKPSVHIESCSFCMEQYDFAVDFLTAAPEMLLSGEGEEATDEVRPKGMPYRLAAQTTSTAIPQYRLRRTWYLDNNAAILRVIEDTVRKSLTGFFIGDRLDAPGIRIRFDGLEQEFVPDRNGVFEIGVSAIDIEPMKVTLLKS